MTTAAISRRRALAYLGAATLAVTGCGRSTITAAAPPDGRTREGEMTTVLTLSGLTYNVVDNMGDALSGFATAPGHIRKAVSYPAAASATSIPAGVIALDDAIRATPGDIVVLAHSQGAQVVGGWLREYAQRPDAPPPDRLRFILLGNPERRLGWNPERKGFDGNPLLPTPDDTQYQVLDITRRWDGWGNADNWPDGDPGLKDKARLMLGRATDHVDYSKVSLDDPAMQVRAQVGNTSYLVAP